MVIENQQGRRRRQFLVLWTLFCLALECENIDALGLSRNPLFNGMLNRRNAIPTASIGNLHHNQQLFKHQQNYHQLLHQNNQPLVPAASSPPVAAASSLTNHVDPYISGSNSLDKAVPENPELDQIAADVQAEQKSNNLAASASSTSYTSAVSGGYGADTGSSLGSYGSGGSVGSYGSGSVSSGGGYGGGSGGAGAVYGSSSVGAIGSYDSTGSIGSYGSSGSYGGSTAGVGSTYGGLTGGSYGGSTGASSFGAGSTGLSSYGTGSTGTGSFGSGGSSYNFGGSSGSSYGLNSGSSSYSVPPYGGGTPSYSVSYPAQQGATKADTIHLLSSLAPSLLLSSLLIPLALALLTNTTSSLIGRKKRDLYNDYDDDLQFSLSGDILDADITLLDAHFFPTMDAMLESYSPDDGERLADFVRQWGLLDTQNPCLEKLACLAATTNSKFKRYDNLKKAIRLLEKTVDPGIKKRLQDGSSVGATKERNCLTTFICKSTKSDVPS
ncbi:keratin, type II cytoskeletal 6B-like isoform X2 [Daphnia carinata]|uniref:keratin, type II cytoskeletal 6B-like isoform X2 n=1 Tax=Daphnia carinata TaxID=120202 RepID=UPI00257E025F|nr:keratin, type II cytoskeletal 6B-like isoform X2 [Daphnia carinata]